MARRAILNTAAPLVPTVPRIKVFVDYWNLQLTLNEREAAQQHQDNLRFKIDWRKLPAWLADNAARTTGIPKYSYEGAIIHASYDRNSSDGPGFFNWATTWLNRQPGIQVECHVRRPRSRPRCNSCHKEIATCPHPECGNPITGTIEKGVDTAIATDMIRLAWENAYDIGVLASLDADLIPAVHFLDQKGKKIVQAGFPPKGVDLATSCWASFDIFANREDIRRK